MTPHSSRPPDTQKSRSGLLDTILLPPVSGILSYFLARSTRLILLEREIKSTSGDYRRFLKAEVPKFKTHYKKKMSLLIEVSQRDPAVTFGQRLLVRFTVMTIAIYRALLELDVDRTEARAAMADATWRIYSAMISITSWPVRLTTRDPSKRLRRTVKILLWFPFKLTGTPGYAANVWQDGDQFFTHFTHCPPQSFVRRLEALQGGFGDLEAFQQSWCRYDFPGADIIAGDAKRGHYSRRKTLSHGDFVCDMCWKGQPRKEKLR